ncbi:MAG: FlgD immunoglobulin-like domain containing protein [Candidatus Latescibacterota bacterium]
MLFVRTESNGLPGPNEPVDFDQPPFITRGLGPGGQSVQYYNFDVMPRETAPIFVLIREGEDAPVEGQLNIVDVIPGDEGYNDFWHVHFVTVASDYEANTITSVDSIMAGGYAIEASSVVVNCPIVPDGSTASHRYTDEDAGLVRGWYKDQVVYYFNFSEKAISVDPPEDGPAMVPVSPIHVTFNVNPGEDGGGPPSGFVMEEGSDQTHNVVETLPEDDTYSPLWRVDVYDNSDFEWVYNLSSALEATELATGAAIVNCPIVAKGGRNPETAPRTVVDRFSEDAGMLFVRTEDNGFPEAGEPIDFDEAPFITRGFSPDGRSIQYYNFDVMPVETAPIFALFREGEDAPVEGQLNIVDVVPGDGGYNDFWHVHKVTVPADYEANTITSVDALMDAGYDIERTPLIVNCPVVPDGSTASLRYTEENDSGLVEGWYRGQVIYYFDFSEKMLTAELPESGPLMVPMSPIYVSFNVNPGEDGGGPPSGFMTEEGSDQTHNVVATMPEDATYSPLWNVNIYDNAEFGSVSDLQSAVSATILAEGAAMVNCPVVSGSQNTAVERLPGDVPAKFALEGNYPNPFNPQTTIQYSLDEPGMVTLRIYDLLGQKVAELVHAEQSGGAYRVTWDGLDAGGRRAATGVYLYQLSLNGRISEARTMTLLK